jgi:hypothetical protein
MLSGTESARSQTPRIRGENKTSPPSPRLGQKEPNQAIDKAWVEAQGGCQRRSAGIGACSERQMGHEGDGYATVMRKTLAVPLPHLFEWPPGAAGIARGPGITGTGVGELGEMTDAGLMVQFVHYAQDDSSRLRGLASSHERASHVVNVNRAWASHRRRGEGVTSSASLRPSGGWPRPAASACATLRPLMIFPQEPAVSVMGCGTGGRPFASPAGLADTGPALGGVNAHYMERAGIACPRRNGVMFTMSLRKNLCPAPSGPATLVHSRRSPQHWRDRSDVGGGGAPYW